MLYEQIYESSKSTRRKSVKASTGIVSANFESTSEEWSGRDKKLRAVEEDLQQRKIVGTIDDPKDYFKGFMSMRWGLFNDCGTRPEDELPFVYFGGFDKAEPLIVGLGGSSKHVVGHEGATGATSTWARSSTDAIVRWLLAGLRNDGPPDLPEWCDRESEESQVFSGMAIALHNLGPPTQELEFLAKTLTTGTLYGHKHVTGAHSARAILGTPLYVAQTHQLPDKDNYGLDDQW